MLSKNKIKQYRSLSQKKQRTKEGLFLAEGKKLVNDLLESNLEVREIYGTTDAIKQLVPTSVPTFDVDFDEIKKVSQLKNPQNIFAVIELPRHSFDSNDLIGKLTIALDDVQDPGNLGTIIRIADWFGIETILCSKGTVDTFNPKVIQATMGAIARVKVVYVDLEEELTKATSSGLACYGTFLEGTNLYSEDLPSEAIVVMGNEGQGISDPVRAIVTNEVLIPSFPMDQPTSESLNVAVATSIVCSEFRRNLAQ